MDEKELLEYARKHYPIGTQYVPAHVNDGINEVIDTDYNYDERDKYLHVKSKNIEKEYNCCIYSGGKWAEIVFKPEEKSKKPTYELW